MQSQLFFPFATNSHPFTQVDLYSCPQKMAPGLRHYPHADQAKLHLYGENKDIWIGDINSRYD
jgi:hypothetical protein